MSTNCTERISTVLLAAVILVAGGLRQPIPRAADQGSTSKIGSKSSYASCFDATDGRYLGSQTVRTKTLASPDGRYRAYAESISLGTPGNSAECSSTSRLFVAGPEKSSFRVVLTVRPAKELHGNSLQLVGWSPSSHLLLFSQGHWDWGSDVGGEDMRAYDADTGVVSTKKLLAGAFSKHFARVCSAVFEAQGFSSDSKVIVIAKPWFDFGEEVPSKDSCSGKDGRWSIDFATGEIKPVEGAYKVEHPVNSLAGRTTP